jgi:gas vesicle structural protein
MAVATNGTSSNYLQRAPSPSGLADVLDVILDKGLVIDAYIRVSVIGIELLTVDARIVIASVDTYLRFAEQVNRLDLRETQLAGLPELQERGAEKMTEQEMDKAEEKGGSALKKAAAAAAAASAAAGATAAAKSLAERRR